MRASTSVRPAPLGLFVDSDRPLLYDRAVEILKTRHYSPRTQETYLNWIRRYIRFHAGRHPRELAEADVNAFLSDLATTLNVAAATQNQALAAILFLYEHVLGSRWIESKASCEPGSRSVCRWC
jgi:site-specific recombinase XerD